MDQVALLCFFHINVFFKGDPDSEPGGQPREAAALNSKATASAGFKPKEVPYQHARYRVGLVVSHHTSAEEPDNTKKAVRGALESVRYALEAAGHQVTTIDLSVIAADPSSANKLDICFNMAEGTRGAAREMQVPALLEMLGLSYAGSGPLSVGLSRDKAAWKKLLRISGVRTAPFQVFENADEVSSKFDPSLGFPLIVKLAKCAMLGTRCATVVNDLAGLQKQVRSVFDMHRQPVIAESFLSGREFIVGLIGNKLKYGEVPESTFYNDDGYHVFPICEIVDHLPGSGYRFAIANIPNELVAELQQMAVASFEALECSDIACIRFRLDANGTPYVLAINNMLGDIVACTSGIWLMPSGQNFPYEELVNRVLSLAARRCQKTGNGPSRVLPPHTSFKRSDVPDELWNDWRWQMANRLTTKEHFQSLFELTPEEIQVFDSAKHFPVAATPYFANLIDPKNPNDPVRKQILPSMEELKPCSADIEDSLSEDEHSPVPGLTHRYPDRCLMLVSMICASYCRFCTRNRVVGTNLKTLGSRSVNGKMTRASPKEFYDTQLDYIRRTPQIRDVLLSGGDPLLLPKKTLEYILSNLKQIPHVQVIRIGSRVPVFLPQRITPSLCNLLKRFHPLWLNTHVNHPNELSPTCVAALGRLSDAGIPLGCQTVLLAGVNDCPNIMKALVQKLVQSRVRPYNLYQCDLVVGAEHFRTPVSKVFIYVCFILRKSGNRSY